MIISSEFQLESSSADTLFLHVSEVVIATEGTVNAWSLTDIAKKTRSVLAEHDLMAVELFEERITKVGFRWTDDYSDKLWLVRGETLYEVREGFPRITTSIVPTGVGNVGYAISLPECEAFRVDPGVLRETVTEVTDDH